MLRFVTETKLEEKLQRVPFLVITPGGAELFLGCSLDTRLLMLPKAAHELLHAICDYTWCTHTERHWWLNRDDKHTSLKSSCLGFLKESNGITPKQHKWI